MSVNPNLVRQMLERDLSAAQNLYDLLSRESELLKQRDHAQLSKIVEEKSEQMAVLDAHARERSALLESLNLPADTQGWVTFMQSSESLASLLPVWDDLQARVQDCKTINATNGKLISRSQQTLSRLLDIMRGKTGAPGLYDAKGSATNSGHSNTSVRA